MATGIFNQATVRAAEAAIQAAIDAALSPGARRAVVGVAPAGAGKSYAIGSAVEAARRQKLRVAVATPTNQQAFALVKNLAARMPRETITFVHANHVELPAHCKRRNVVERAPRDTHADGVIVGTLSKLGDAFAREHLHSVDLLLIDEAFQANAVHYYLVGDLADRHLLMGDSGQLAPFSTAPEADRWRGLDEDPLLTAVDVLRRNHPGTREYKLPITRRLDPRAVPIAKAFYPQHEFEAAVMPDVRRLDLRRSPGGRAARTADAALERAAAGGWAHVELPSTAVLSADPQTIELVVGIVKRLFERDPHVRCEDQQTPAPLRPDQVAVAVSHNDQKDQLRVALDEANLQGVTVNTANKLQGLTYEVVIAWHPLAGLQDVDEFHLDPGRLCVMLTRHRQACIVIGRAADRELVQGIPPATPCYVGWDANPSLDGWYVHEAVFNRLEPHRLEA